jgi:hypothetical protein
MVTGIDINNASIALKNAEIDLIKAQAAYQQKQSELNQILAQQNVDDLTAANVKISADIAAANAAPTQLAP